MWAFVSVRKPSLTISSRYLDRCFRWMPAAKAIAFCVSACGRTYRSSMFRKSEKYRRMRSSVVSARGEFSFTIRELPAARITLRVPLRPSRRHVLKVSSGPRDGDALPPGPACAGRVRGDLRRGHAGGHRERLVHPVPRREAPLWQDALSDPRPLGLHDEDRLDDRSGG